MVDIGGVRVEQDGPFTLLAGPCVIESRDAALRHAERIAAIAERVGVPYIFKSSYDKANRTSVDSFRGPGLEAGLEILAEVRERFGVPVITDVHERQDVAAVAEAVDVLQIPAFLCRQTDLVLAACGSGKPVNIKKGQFLSPAEAVPMVHKAHSTGNTQVMVTERGHAFGYQNLVVDYRSLVLLRETGAPVLFDATHSVQLPGGAGEATAGQPRFIPHLARAAVAVGVAGVFMEVHEDPSHALSDGSNSLALDQLPALLGDLKALDTLIKGTE
ncbi:3-deoxy-8-phosphooctulonate synthase [Streptomyces sp. BHT-5-2]|uniref:3-deoxy-8-phosphooctulonate synthase n=1 Tax=Streptomyces sp. BHT-5-2 TaxID=2866715 RepID=UPI001C8E10BA|nr:3-deoxy-8-phosphooctulonate synthase [Streptomyces sp. BHT-5-2]QZL04512.1 3-deoxy-8-phosphooctulonate synthase [Streptomyces sp. BHT-5-2]